MPAPGDPRARLGPRAPRGRGARSGRPTALRGPWLPAFAGTPRGDVNAFFGLALDNLTQLVILSSLLIGVFKFPADLVLFRMIPGTALGVLIGDLTYTWLALRLARQTGRQEVTAMPFGIDTPSLFGIVFGGLGPVTTHPRASARP